MEIVKQIILDIFSSLQHVQYNFYLSASALLCYLLFILQYQPWTVFSISGCAFKCSYHGHDDHEFSNKQNL